jgi:hypothetical protein
LEEEGFNIEGDTSTGEDEDDEELDGERERKE